MKPIDARISSNDLIVSDLDSKDMSYVATVRSDVPRGRLAGIEPPKLPRDYLFISARDVPGIRTVGTGPFPVPILAEAGISYLGEPVALIAGPDPDLAAQFARETVVEIESSPPVFLAGTEKDEIVFSERVDSGDAEMAFTIASRIVECRFATGSQDHWYPEPQGTVAYFDYDKLVLVCSTQWPFHVRDTVAAALGAKNEEIVVRPSALGPHMDGKLWYPSLLSSHAALAAILGRRPAKLIYSRLEDFLYTPKRAPAVSRYRVALDGEGKILCVEADIVIDTGAYAPFAREQVRQTALTAFSMYSCPNISVVVKAVRTNKPPMGAFAGLGSASAFFGVERLFDELARELGFDSMDLRSANLARKGAFAFNGAPVRNTPPVESLMAALARASDYDRKHAAYELQRKRKSETMEIMPRGIGASFCHQGAGTAFSGSDPAPGGDARSRRSENYHMELELTRSLELVIKTSSIPSNAGTVAVWKDAAARITGLKREKIRLEPVRTDNVPDSGPVTQSRNISIIFRLLEGACAEMVKRRAVETLPLTVVRTARLPKRGADPAGTSSGNPFEGSSFAGAVVELELDRFTCEPEILGVWMRVEAGTILSELHARRTLESGVMAALGQCMYERVEFRNGRLDIDDFRSYRFLRPDEVPTIHLEFAESKDHPRGLGELPFGCIPAAFANALSQALDRSWNELPVDPAVVQEGIS